MPQFATRSALAVMCLTILAACQTIPTTGTDLCPAFAPITYSAKNDTSETVRQIREHNAAWQAICGGSDDEPTQ
jgi:hypothetical protein